MTKLSTALSLLSVAAAVAAEAKEVEVAQIRIQRRDPIELAWGEENDTDELTYGLNQDGTASLWVGTEDGTKRIVDPDAIRIVKPYRLAETDYVVYPIQPSDAAQPVIQVGDDAFSMWNYISGSTTNRYGKPGVTGGTRELKVQTTSPDTRIAYLTWEWTDTVIPGDGLTPTSVARTTIEDANDGQFVPEHTLAFMNNYMNMNDNPPGGVISNIVVYGYAGDVETSVIDASLIDVTVKESDGREYKLGRMHHMIESIHYTQDRWAYYKAADDVKLADKRLYLDSDKFSYISSDGNLGGAISTDLGPMVSWDRGNVDPAPFIKGISVETNGTVKLYASTKFGANLSVLYASSLGSTFTAISSTNNGIVDYGDGKAYEIVAAGAGSTGFYKVNASIAAADERQPSVTIHPDVVKFGSDEAELQLIEITIGNTTLEVLGRVKP